MQDLLTSLDSVAGLAVLALLAYGDTLIGIGMFVFGEIAFLAAGAAFVTGSSLPAVVVFSCAWAGDVTSYWLGRRYGTRMSTPLLRRLKFRKVWRRAQTKLARRGTVFVVMSRFLGPVAWITPFLAGTFGMPARTFLPAAGLGVVLGVGQFLIYGAIGATLLDRFLPVIMDHLGVIGLGVCMVLSGLYVWRRSEQGVWLKSLLAGLMAVAVFLVSNLGYFFVLNSHAAPTAARPGFEAVCDAARGPFIVHPGETDLHLPQPVNVILLSQMPGAELMAALGWHRNATFTHDEIDFATYLRLLGQNTPPVSELYLAGSPADSTHQMSGTLKVREHIRWWQMGAGVHFGAISKTKEIAIKYYSHLPVLMHDIDPKVNVSRGGFAFQLAALSTYEVVGLAALTPPVRDGVVADYETDGGVLVLSDTGYDVPDSIRNCLRIWPSGGRQPAGGR